MLNVFRMFAKMGGERIATESSAEVPLERIVAAGVREQSGRGRAREPRRLRRLAVMVWHYHDDDVAGPDADVTLALAGLPAAASGARITHYRVDETHGNAYGEWKRMGSPIAPNDAQYARLLEASKLATIAGRPRRARERRRERADVPTAAAGRVARGARLERDALSGPRG